MQDAKRKGRMAFGIRNGRAKLDDDKISTIRLVLMCGESKSSIARRYGVCPPTIHKIAIGKNWKHVGEGKI
jgi:transposase-like protein